MKTISSAEFRKTYSTLKEATTVTANGRYIGTWSPAVSGWVTDIIKTRTGGWVSDQIDATGEQVTLHSASPKETRVLQAERDAILRRINKGG